MVEFEVWRDGAPEESSSHVGGLFGVATAATEGIPSLGYRLDWKGMDLSASWYPWSGEGDGIDSSDRKGKGKEQASAYQV